jgi:hypothetical protein
MALAHNGIIRGLNAIHIQAANIPKNDLAAARDFMIYCQCWSESMHHHHDAEEDIFFPEIETITRMPGLMQVNKDQHAAFTPGFEKFWEYCKACLPRDYDGMRLRSLVEEFAEPLTKHLHDEIETLRKLDKYDSEAVRKAYKRLEKILMNTDNASALLSVTESMLTCSHRIESHRWYSEQRTGASKAVCMIFPRSLSSCRMSFTMFLGASIGVHGDIILARPGEIARN